MRFSVALQGTSAARGYVLEVFSGHFELPDLGPIGLSAALSRLRCVACGCSTLVALACTSAQPSCIGTNTAPPRQCREADMLAVLHED